MPAGTFDAGGVACPAPVVNGGDTGWWVYHTSLSAAGAPSIGLHTVSGDLVTVPRTATTPVLTSGGTYDAAGQADPCVVAERLGPRPVLRRQGRARANWSLGSRLDHHGHSDGLLRRRTRSSRPTPGTYDAGGLRHPVAHTAPRTAAGVSSTRPSAPTA